MTRKAIESFLAAHALLLNYNSSLTRPFDLLYVEAGDAILEVPLSAMMTSQTALQGPLGVWAKSDQVCVVVMKALGQIAI